VVQKCTSNLFCYVVQQKTFRASSHNRQPPRLEVLKEEEGIEDGYICCDGHVLQCNSTSVATLLLCLIQCYYSWQLAYPTQYQLLPFLQEHILGTKLQCSSQLLMLSSTKDMVLVVLMMAWNKIADWPRKAIRTLSLLCFSRFAPFNDC